MSFHLASKTAQQLFFEDPHLAPGLAGEAVANPVDPASLCRKYGILYHLRRNINVCMQVQQGEPQSPWASAVLICAGIDLLAKHYAGTDEFIRNRSKKREPWRYAVGVRFEQFIKDYFPAPANTASKRIYDIRNNLLHSFGIYTAKPRCKYHLIVSASNPTVLQQISQTRCGVNVSGLHQAFEASILSYRAALGAAGVNDKLTRRFDKMYQRYGWFLVFPTQDWGTLSTMTISASGMY